MRAPRPSVSRRRTSTRTGVAVAALTGLVAVLGVPAVQAAPSATAGPSGTAATRVTVPAAGLPTAVDRSTLARISGADTGTCGTAGLARWKSFIGTTPTTVNDNIYGISWDTITDPSYVLGCWGPAVRRGAIPVYSVALLPMARPATTTLAQGAAGAYDQYFRTLGTRLIAGGESNTILRLGWEFNGNWQTWRAAADPASYVAYFRREASLLHNLPGSHIKIEWNLTAGYAETDARTVYPGNDVVDLIGIDAYDGGFVPGSYPIPANATPADALLRRMKAWTQTKSGFNGLDTWAAFARAHRKPLAVGEWGLIRSVGTGSEPHGGGDDAYYITQMRVWLATNKVSYASYFNRQANYDSYLDPRPTNRGVVTAFPLARPVFQRLFGAKGQGTLPHPARGAHSS